MDVFKFCAAALILATIAAKGNALAIYEIGNLNIDKSTGLEWLDVGTTNSNSGPYFSSEDGSWRKATRQEYEGLLGSFGFDLSPDKKNDQKKNQKAAEKFVAFMGDSNPLSGGDLDEPEFEEFFERIGPYTLGFLEDYYYKEVYEEATIEYWDYTMAFLYANGYYFREWTFDDYIRTPLNGTAGTFWVRESIGWDMGSSAPSDVTPVPLPAGLPLFAAGLAALAWIRRRR